MPARIFISHSCKDLQPKDGDDPKSKRLTFAGLVRGKIVDSLGDPTPAGLGYKVLLDKARLEPADNWRAKLHGWLGSCHGAVILLSEDSVTSEWLIKEATILTWRKSLRPEFLVVPVFLGDLRSSALKKHGLGCLQLTEIEAARLAPGDLPGAGGKVEDLSDEEREALAAALTAKVRKKFEDLSVLNDDSQMAIWINSVAARLEPVHATFLDKARKALLIDDKDWSSDDGYLARHDLLGRTATLAHQLLSAEFGRVYAAMNALRQGMQGPDFEWLISRVACQWVDARAAQQLLPAARSGNAPATASRLLALNAIYDGTPDMYVDRACCCELPPERRMSISKPTGEELEKELRNNVERALISHLRLPAKLQNAEKEKGARRTDLLKRREKLLEKRLAASSLPFFVTLDLDAEGDVRATALEELRAAREHITYVLLAGDDFSSIEGDAPNVERVEPELAPGVEDNGESDRGSLEGLVA